MYIFYIIRIIESFSFVFAILSFAFHFISKADYSGLLFILSSALAFFCCLLKEKNKKLYYIPVLLIMLLLLFDHSTSSILFTAIVMIFNYYFIRKDIFKSDQGTIIDEFKAGFASIIIIFIFAVVTGSTSTFGRVSAPFLVIYLISSVILLRSLRNSQFTEKSKYASTSNITYGLLVVLVSFILSTEKLRTGMFYMIRAAYFVIIGGVTFLFSHVFGFMGYFLEVFFDAVRKLLSKANSKAFDSLNSSTSGDSQNPFKNHINKALLNSPSFRIIIEICLAVIFLYLLYKMFDKKVHLSKDEEEFTENKDFILFNKSENKKSFRRFLKPITYIDYIRYYYYKFLRLANKHNIGITSSDTTLDINNKAKSNFSRDTLESMRNIYIKARYGEKDMNKEDVNDIKKLYKKIKIN